MTGEKLVRAVEGICRGRKLDWMVFCPIFQPDAHEGWWYLTAWSGKRRTTLRVHADWLTKPDQMATEVVRQLQEAA